MVKSLVKQAIKENSDIVICDFYSDYSDKQSIVKCSYRNYENYLWDIIRSRWAVVWNKLIRKSLFTEYHICFPEKINGGEDYCGIVMLSYYAKNVSFVSQCLYHHVNYNTNSIMKSPSYNSLFEQVQASEVVSSFLSKKTDGCKYQHELNQRKLYTKTTLLLYAIRQWNGTFQEANSAIVYFQCGWRQKLKYLFIYLFCRLLK